MKTNRILLAEDDIDFGSILKQYLEIHDFDVVWAKDGEEAFNAFAKAHNEKSPFDIGVFDVMMPKMDGFSLAEKVIDQYPDASFVFLTARSLKEDRIQGLKLGADDYIVKPFEADILVLRLQNILKRTQRLGAVITTNDQPDATTYAIGDYQFDPYNHQLIFGTTLQHLTEKEASLIQFFYKNKNQMLRREAILTAIWGNDDFFSGRSMDVFISRLRKYFNQDDRIAIESTRGVGLTFKIKL